MVSPSRIERIWEKEKERRRQKEWKTNLHIDIILLVLRYDDLVVVLRGRQRVQAHLQLRRQLAEEFSGFLAENFADVFLEKIHNVRFLNSKAVSST